VAQHTKIEGDSSLDDIYELALTEEPITLRGSFEKVIREAEMLAEFCKDPKGNRVIFPHTYAVGKFTEQQFNDLFYYGVLALVEADLEYHLKAKTRTFIKQTALDVAWSKCYNEYVKE